jgi:hypothetical protein
VETLQEARSFGLGGHDWMLLFPIDSGIEIAGGEGTDQLRPWDVAVLSGREEREVRIVGRGRGETVKLFVASLPRDRAT